jgi:hypothetical protein
MKKILALFIGLSLFTSCTDTTDEDSYYQKTIHLSVTDYIKVYTQSSFNVGDKLYLESIFSKLQDEPGYPNKLDIFKTTNSRQFSFYFTLEKKVFNGNWTNINFNATDFETGGLGSINYNLAICELNQNNTQYEFYKGIILQETGQYRLTIQPSINNYYFGNGNVNVEFFTTIENLTGTTYEFTVN